MAEVIAHGTATPTGLSVLVDEGFLSRDAPESAYQWRCYPSFDQDLGEELVYTKDCVIYSCAGSAIRIFRFPHPQEAVLFAELTTFPSPGLENTGRVRDGSEVSNCLGHTDGVPLKASAATFRDGHALRHSGKHRASKPLTRDGNRAVCIIVEKQCHIFFVQGSSYTVSLPFDVESVFAAPSGLVIQRRHGRSRNSPVIPAAPPNSFLFPQLQSSGSASFLSPDEVDSSVFLQTGLGHDAPESPHFVCIRDPSSEIAAVAVATVAPLPRHHRIDDEDLLIEYDDFDEAEALLYVSTKDEISTRPSAGNVVPLLLVVTFNEELGQLTVWQGWYVHRPPLSQLMRVRRAVKTSRARRRSSFTNSVIPPNVSTPMVRFREKGRESFAANAQLPEPKSASRSRRPRTSKRTAEEEADAMASQMDPDFRASQRSIANPLRAGSVLTRGDIASHDAARSGKTGTHGRRGPSLRMSQDRRSFGTSLYRKSHGSVRGSFFNRSIGTNIDDSMDIDADSTADQDVNHEALRAARLFIATNDLSTAEAAFHSIGEGAKPELVVRKIHVHPFASIPSHQAATNDCERFKVRITSGLAVRDGSAAPLMICIHDKTSNRLTKFEFVLSLCNLTEAYEGSKENQSLAGQIPVPLFHHHETVNSIYDMDSIQASQQQAIVGLQDHGQLLVISSNAPSRTLQMPEKVSMFDIADVTLAIHQGVREVGLKRTLSGKDNYTHLRQSSLKEHILVRSKSGLEFSIRIFSEPCDPLIARSLDVIGSVLPLKAALMIRQIWWAAVRYLGTFPDARMSRRETELQALVIAVLSFAIGSLGRSSKPKIARARVSSASRPGSFLDQLQADLPFVRHPSSWSRLVEESLKPGASSNSLDTANGSIDGKSNALSFTKLEAQTRTLLHSIASDNLQWLLDLEHCNDRSMFALQILLALRLNQEEMKLSTARLADTVGVQKTLAATTAQLGHYLDLPAWTWQQQNTLTADFDFIDFDFSSSTISGDIGLGRYRLLQPFDVFEWLERGQDADDNVTFGSLEDIARLSGVPCETGDSNYLLPAITAINRFRSAVPASILPHTTIERILDAGFDQHIIDDLPEAAAAGFSELIRRCQSQPPSAWPRRLLDLVDRADIHADQPDQQTRPHQTQLITRSGSQMQAITAGAERHTSAQKSNVADRNAVSSQIFTEDRRLVDAAALMDPSALQLAECPSKPGWSEVEHLDQQKKLMTSVVTRTISLPAGNGMFSFESQMPLTSERFEVPGFSMQCQMKPMNNTISADRSGFTEEKMGWAFFHAGAGAGLSISRSAKGIDTSWIVLHKPDDLTNRHAGLLLALGLNGHLKTMAKWLAFKYLTPKHTMTSIGVLLGLSASHLGTMDTLITRMLSVHITRMLPPGAAELNVSPLTQTAGLVGIGLLYYNTQHRRMSEIMLSEIEHRDNEEAGSAADVLRDESYRLAAGFSLGLLNLGKGNQLQGLQGMGLLERLLSIAVGTKPVELVHIIDKATAGAIIAIALIYMKTGDETVANKVDVPTTPSQVDHIRPDVLLLRTLARNLIMWEHIRGEIGWIRSQLPSFAAHMFAVKKPFPDSPMRSTDVPIYNIIAGHAWSLSLKFAGSASVGARDEILAYLDLFWTLSQQEADYYDARLTLTTLRRCIDILALSAATVMAGTGDLTTLRYLRRLHGRTDAQTTYGSHMAAHLAIGAIFLGGGTYTFSTSNLAVAGLIMAFYPLFPSEVLDNAVHLQAFRHLWVLAAEARCVVCVDADTGSPVAVPVQLTTKGGEIRRTKSPSLLPEFDTIASIETLDKRYWPVRLDFVADGERLMHFKSNPSILVRKAPATEASPLVFSQVLAAMIEKQTMPSWFAMWAWLLGFPAMKQCADLSELDLMIPTSEKSISQLSERGTVVDARLSLWRDAGSTDVQRLKNIRLLLRWADERTLDEDPRLRWLGNTFVEKLLAVIEERMVQVYGREPVE